MAARRRPWSTKPVDLSSDVVEDGDSDFDLRQSRVPILGLPSYSKQHHDSRCDSGVFESFTSGASSIRSSYADRSSYVDSESTLDSVDETILQDKLNSLSLIQASERSSERLPSVDEGFYSADLKQESWNKSYTPNIVLPPELPEVDTSEESDGSKVTEDDYLYPTIDDRVLDIFVSDEEGDT